MRKIAVLISVYFILCSCSNEPVDVLPGLINEKNVVEIRKAFRFPEEVKDSDILDFCNTVSAEFGHVSDVKNEINQREMPVYQKYHHLVAEIKTPGSNTAIQPEFVSFIKNDTGRIGMRVYYADMSDGKKPIKGIAIFKE